MPNAARDVIERPGRKIFVLGSTGSGKTTQFLTLPGKKFMYLFDPNAILSIKGYDVDYEELLLDKFFDSYENIAIDSGTTLSDAIMDGVLSINGRAGQWPQQDDYGPQMLALTNIIRTFTALDKNFYFTGHMELKQDDLTKRIFWTPLLP